MKRTLRIILFVGTFVLILALVGIIALKIGEYRLTGEQGASAEYSILRNAVSPITSEQELGDQFIRDRFKSLYSASAHLLAVQVLDRNGLVLWKMPDDSPYFASPASSPGSVFRAPGLSTVIYMTPLPDGMKLMALYSILTQRDIANILLLPIIILAVWIILLIVLQFVFKEKPAENITEENPSAIEPQTTEKEDQAPEDLQPEEPQALEEEAQASEGEPATEAAASVEEETTAGPVAETAVEAPGKNLASVRSEEKETIEETPEESAETIDNAKADTEEVTAEGSGAEPVELDQEMEEILEEEEKKEPAPQQETPPTQPHIPDIHEQAPAPQAPLPKQPEILHKEETPIPEKARPAESEYDLGQAEFVAPPEKTEPPAEAGAFPSSLSLDTLKRTLEGELQRNQETTLLFIQCVFSGESDPSALAIGVTIRDYFASESLVFELAKGSYAAVLPGTDAGSGLKLAVDLDDVLTTTASLYKDIADEPPFFFGISALYDRPVSPERLYKEALAALQKAHESGSRILAFKPANLPA